jgi:hypothetical protein
LFPSIGPYLLQEFNEKNLVMKLHFRRAQDILNKKFRRIEFQAFVFDFREREKLIVTFKRSIS